MARPDRESSGGGEPRPRVVVRETRYGRELIVDDTFASFYRPGRATTGSVWDALAAPILALAPGQCRSLLVLGLGGGSVARVARALVPAARIVGVEFDPEVLRVARDDFDLDELGIEVVQGDARAYLAQGRRRFDAIIEDVFIGSGDAVYKPAWLPDWGLRQAARRLTAGGVLISNSIDEFGAVAATMRDLFAHVLSIGIEDYDNRIVAGSQEPLGARTLRGVIAKNPVLCEALPQLRIRTLPRLA